MSDTPAHEPTTTTNSSLSAEPAAGPPDDGDANPSKDAAQTLVKVVVGTIAGMLAKQLDPRDTVDELWKRLDQLAGTAQQRPVAEPPPVPPPAFTWDWGVTERPTQITYDFCYRLRWQSTPKAQKELVPSASSRSQYLRIANMIPAAWGRRLDEQGVFFERLRWIAAPNDFIARSDRYARVLAGEHPADLVRRKKSGQQQATGAVDAPKDGVTEEDFVRIEAMLKEMTGQELRLPRDQKPVTAEEPKNTGGPRARRSRRKGPGAKGSRRRGR